MQILVTGAAGFIGFHTCKRLLNEGYQVVGVDNLNDYYDPRLKLARLAELGVGDVDIHSDSLPQTDLASFTFIKADIEDDQLWKSLAIHFNISSVIHLAAQAGVRYSLENPKAYVKSNVEGFLNVLEFCRHNKISELIYASSSSVYGMDSEQPFSERESCNKPVSLYAATKRSNELMAYTYHHLFGIKSMGLRFFTVYGPWGRPDMAPFLFTKAAMEGLPIRVFNHGKQSRDFTYIDDIVEGIFKIHREAATIKDAEVCNIGQGAPVSLMDFISSIEKSLDCVIAKDFVESQPGDVQSTYADTSGLVNRFKFVPAISVEEGVDMFVRWYRKYYNLI
jgi:UDP-glucuronate 4-epimerase